MTRNKKEFEAQLKRDRASAQKALERVEHMLNQKHGVVAGYNAMAHSCAILTRQLGVLSRRLREGEQLGAVPSGPVASNSAGQELAMLECDVMELAEVVGQTLV